MATRGQYSDSEDLSRRLSDDGEEGSANEHVQSQVSHCSPTPLYFPSSAMESSELYHVKQQFFLGEFD